MEKKSLQPSSTLLNGEERKPKIAHSKDQLRRCWLKVQSRFGNMAEAERVDELREFWAMGYEVSLLDEKTGCIYSSAPLMRVFTICHDQLAEGYLRCKGEKLSTREKTEAAVQDVKNSIESTIRRLKGVVKEGEGSELGHEFAIVKTSCFYGFQEGFGSDDHLVGMFFSEVGRTNAIEEVVKEWGEYGVRTEPLSCEKDLHAQRTHLWNSGFNRKEFRKQFRKLSHAERLKEIEDLSAKGIKLQFKDPKTCIVYATHEVPFGLGQCSRKFSYDFKLRYPEESLPTASERRGEVDRIERSLFGIIAKHKGFVTEIERDLILASNACIRLQDSADFDGEGNVYAEFPNEAARRHASEEVFETLARNGVEFPLEKGEKLSTNEQIVKNQQERDAARKRLDAAWHALEGKQERHRQEERQLKEEETELKRRQLEFEEIERNLAETTKIPNHEQVAPSDRKLVWVAKFNSSEPN